MAEDFGYSEDTDRLCLPCLVFSLRSRLLVTLADTLPTFLRQWRVSWLKEPFLRCRVALQLPFEKCRSCFTERPGIERHISTCDR